MALCLNPDLVNGSLHGAPRDVGMVQGIAALGHNILEQRATQRDVEHLIATADRQEGAIQAQPALNQPQFRVVACLVDASRPGLLLLPVRRRGDVLTAAQEQPVQFPE